jgi:hypothetical protein
VKRISKRRLADGIFLLRFETQYELASSFLRIQEHYESRRFAGRVFSLEEFMDWYAAEFGGFTYYQDWVGFNVPSSGLVPFRAGKFDPLLEKEKRILRFFARERAPFYVIGVTRKGSHRELTHELAHALYFTDKTYRRAVQEAMQGYDTSSIGRKLYRIGYARHVICDEVHAYLVAPGHDFGKQTRGLAPLRRTLRGLFRRHSKRLSLPTRA